MLEEFTDHALEIVFNQETKSVGSRGKMCNQLFLQDVESADDMVLIADCMNASEEFI